MEKRIKPDSSKWVAVVAATAGSFLTPFMGSSINIALPTIAKDFAMDAILLTWVATSYALAAATFLVPFGRIADIYGRKRIFLYGIVFYVVSCVLTAISPSAIVFIGFRVMQGIGSAMIFGTGVAILTSVLPPGERGRALGINATTVHLGHSLGPFLGGFLTHYFGWRSIFLINVPLGLVIVFLILWKMKGEWAEARGEKFDFSGSIIYGLSLITIMYGLSLLPSMPAAWLIPIGVLGILAFIKWESRAASPVFDFGIFKNNAIFAFSNLAAFINYGATFAVMLLSSLYLQYEKGLSPQSAGLILIAQPVVMALLSPLAGRLSDRIEPRVVSSIGMALTFVALVLFAFLTETTALSLVVVTLMILGAGLAFFSSPNANAIMGSVEKKFYGVASATIGTTRLTGNMLSLGIVTLLFGIYIGRVQITPEYYPLFMKSMKVAFTIFAALCLGGIFASLARGKVR